MCTCLPSPGTLRNVAVCLCVLETNAFVTAGCEILASVQFVVAKLPADFLTIKIYYMFLNWRFLACQIPSPIYSALELLQCN